MTGLDRLLELHSAGFPPEHIAAVRQILEWAQAYMENETCLLETPRERMTPGEAAAVDFLFLVFQESEL